MSNDFYDIFMSNVSEIQYDSDFWTKLSPAIKFEGKYELTLVDCILENIYDILRYIYHIYIT